MSPGKPLTPFQRVLKRGFDLLFSVIGLVATGWVIALAWIIAMIDTGESGFFTQERVGRAGRPFRIFKIRTMRPVVGVNTTVTTVADARITRWGRFFRRMKIDELPQLINILSGDMSFVGPRPDVPGFADLLTGDDKIILAVRPGVTGPATLKYRHEEETLAQKEDPERYNREVIFPDKVVLNRLYVENYSFIGDVKYIMQTLKSLWR